MRYDLQRFSSFAHIYVSRSERKICNSKCTGRLWLLNFVFDLFMRIGVLYGRVTSLYTEHNNNPYESRVCYVTYSFFFSRPFIVIYYVVTSFNVNNIRLPRCFSSVAEFNEFPISVIWKLSNSLCDVVTVHIATIVVEKNILETRLPAFCCTFCEAAIVPALKVIEIWKLRMWLTSQRWKLNLYGSKRYFHCSRTFPRELIPILNAKDRPKCRILPWRSYLSVRRKG